MEIGGLFLPITYVWMIFVGLFVAGGLWFFLNKTKMGLGIRAVAFSKDVSNLVGINVPLYISIIFGIACAIAGIGGTLVGPTYQVVVFMGYIILMKAFAAAVVGGLVIYLVQLLEASLLEFLKLRLLFMFLEVTKIYMHSY